MASLRDELLSLAVDLGSRVRGVATRLAREFGTDPYEIVPYRGHGTPDRVYVHGRVIETKGVSAPTADDSTWRNLINTVKRLESDPLPHARVRARIGETEHEIIADNEGFFAAWIPTNGKLASGLLWHPVELELLGPLPPGHVPVRATALVLLPPAGAAYGVISDLDDTVIQSHITSFLRAARTMLLDNARTRLPFPGVAAFYQALHNGNAAAPNPIFYVSSSPWNLHDVLAEFLEHQGIPMGPLLLRDWDFNRAMTASDRHLSHKGDIIRGIVALHPTLPFILIGDSGQQDPEIYKAIVEEFPDRILAVYIRNVLKQPERVAAINALANEIRVARSSLVLADDTLAAARHAAEHGWIAAEALASIGEEKRADEGTTDAKAPAPGVSDKGEQAPTIIVEG
jgi:phosphatidate phosphatase APP1